jgi:hypothetical protein
MNRPKIIYIVLGDNSTQFVIGLTLTIVVYWQWIPILGPRVHGKIPADDAAGRAVKCSL